MIASSFVKARGTRTGENTSGPFLAVALSLVPNKGLISVLKGQRACSGERRSLCVRPARQRGKGMGRSPGVTERTGQGGRTARVRTHTSTPCLSGDQRVSRRPMPPCPADGAGTEEQATTTMTCMWPISLQELIHVHVLISASHSSQSSLIHSPVCAFSLQPCICSGVTCHTPPHCILTGREEEPPAGASSR